MVPVSRMVVLFARSMTFPLTEYEVDGTCQKPCELWRRCQHANATNDRCIVLVYTGVFQRMRRNRRINVTWTPLDENSAM